MPKIGHVHLKVSDLKMSEEFYKKVFKSDTTYSKKAMLIMRGGNSEAYVLDSLKRSLVNGNARISSLSD